MPTFTRDGVELFYSDSGQGDAVLFLHGFPFNHESWHGQLHAVAQKHRAVAIDHRGFGRSKLGGKPTVALYADDALALMDHLKIDRFSVVGLSMGGYVALELYFQAPNRVAKLVLADTRAGVDSEEGRKGREQTAKDVEAQGSGILVDRMMPKLLLPSSPRAEELARIMRAASKEGAAAASRAMAARQDFTGRLKDIAAPTLVVTGDKDTLIPPSESDAMVKAIPGAKLVTIPNAAHVANLDAPEPFNRALLEFLG